MVLDALQQRQSGKFGSVEYSSMSSNLVPNFRQHSQRVAAAGHILPERSDRWRRVRKAFLCHGTRFLRTPCQRIHMLNAKLKKIACAVKLDEITSRLDFLAIALQFIVGSREHHILSREENHRVRKKRYCPKQQAASPAFASPCDDGINGCFCKAKPSFQVLDGLRILQLSRSHRVTPSD